MKTINRKIVKDICSSAIFIFIVYILFKLMYFFIVVENNFLFYSLIAFIATIFFTSKSKKRFYNFCFFFDFYGDIYNMFTEHCKEIYGCGYATDCYMLPEKKCHKGYEILFSEILIKNPEENTKIHEYAF